MPRKKSQAIQIIKPEQPPILTLSDEQFKILNEHVRHKPFNPMPWIALSVFIIIAGFVSIMALALSMDDPPPVIVYQSSPVFTAAVTETRSPTFTKTYTSTFTPDRTGTFVNDIRWDVIRRYINRVMTGDYGGAWNLLIDRCRYRECWESWRGDFESFKRWWYELGRVEIRSLTPESLSEFNGQAFVVLYFKRDEQPHNYRFYLVFDEGEWKIGRIEYVTLIK